MRKWLILVGVVLVALIAVAFWLGGKAEKAAGEPREVRIPIEDAL